MIEAATLQTLYRDALSDRRQWENLWQECYDYALPNQAKLAGRRDASGQRRTDHLFDATAMDAADQLATALLGQVCPPWSSWFTLKSGPMLSKDEAAMAAPKLEAISEQILAQIHAGNATVELHQCFLELVTAGTACLRVSEAPLGSVSAFRFEAVPLAEIMLLEGADGRLSTIFRPRVVEQNGEETIIVEAIVTGDDNVERIVFIPEDDGEAKIVEREILRASPYIAFRWQKSPGERYGRSPVMKALPDIKTANKVVELILKNASIAVTGIWQADDDGVLNPANITLEPGAIISKAVGSQGLKPLEMPSRFDVSQLVIDELRKRIKSALLADRLAPVEDKTMTATEVLERSAQNALLLAATYGRLQNELLMPLFERAMSVLQARGEIPFFDVDGQRVCLEVRSPIASLQAQRRVQSMLSVLDAGGKLGEDALASLDRPKIMARIAADLGVPSDLLIPQTPNVIQGTDNV